MKEDTCCFSGHRQISIYDTMLLTLKLKKEIKKLIKEGYKNFICGGALGFDTIAALTVINAKEKYSDIKLILALPCENQTQKWQQKDKEVYEKIKLKSDKIIYTSKNYYRGCMFKRNRFMVDHSACCIYYLTKDTGGTAYTVNYAKEKGLILINMA